jgi:hypothetical protein
MLLVLFTLFCLGLILYAVVHEPKENAVGSIVSFRTGYKYQFKIGDYMESYPMYGRFHGLDLLLPIEMPHIYLDNLKKGGHAVNAVFDASQRIKLEGDFSEFFNVLVPKNYEAVALSILSPDVMETLQKHATDFDVEIYGDHLRIISNRMVSKDTELQAKLLEVANKILKEIEDRQRSWSKTNTLQSIDQDLHIYPNPGLRIFGRYVTRSRILISLFWLMCTMPFIMIVVYYVWQQNFVWASIFLAVAIIEYACLQWLTGSMHTLERFRSRYGSKPRIP